MNIKNLEFKAKVDEIEKYENKLLTLKPKFNGLDHQIDTYFNVQHGRLKLREGNIENSLINYDRENIAGSKKSEIILYKHEPNIALKDILARQFGIKIVVDKIRKIYFIDNVKFHFDIVENLGTFVEVEAIDEKEEFSIEELKTQCDKYFNFFELTEKNVVAKSYSDLIIELKN
ncbi:MAG TPA: class IV adenylate cyclase [Niabella sp.]|nr:class IV adenylate cyclase [Niabella sp.]HOZ97435.1 class IV adenylate cyclase [Niabella sp.]HQW15197.1 class IV adenylate cyclase [Niabella sp.]HQX20336.1 class IV adenylate cyclase [Niabella sp.]HQX42167.1 class IV adenylate cyclase [Niabella sp.]